jgi:hypothetical protein
MAVEYRPGAMTTATIVLSSGYEVDVQGDAGDHAVAVSEQDGGWLMLRSANEDRDVYIFVAHVSAIRAHPG